MTTYGTPAATAIYDGTLARRTAAAKQTTRSPARPMTAMTGPVTDLRPGDYLDTVGGQGSRIRPTRAAALVHAVEADYTCTRWATAVVRITLLGSSRPYALRPDCPAQYRRFDS
jgi:hypothetical protein